MRRWKHMLGRVRRRFPCGGNRCARWSGAPISMPRILEEELREIQRRLGTTAERPGDVDRASIIGHQLTNLMCLVVLMQGLSEMN